MQPFGLLVCVCAFVLFRALRARALGCVALLLFFVAIPAVALELGDLNIFSKSGEPFRAEIRVRNLNDEEAVSVRMGIPPREEFIAAGVPYKSYLKNFLFRFRKVNADTGFIEVRNTQPIDDDNIAFLLSVNWSNGGIIREYSVVQAETFQEEATEVIDPAESIQNVAELRMDIVAGDTLENVARAVYLAHFKGTVVTVAQVMTSIRRNNAQALSSTTGAASYKLQANTFIVIPEQEEALSQSAREAQREIDAFYRSTERKPARQRTRTNRQTAQSSQPAVQVVETESDASVAQATGGQSGAQVRLLAEQAQSTQAKIALQEERLAVLFEERTNLVEQTQSLDKQVNDIDNILSVKSVELLNLQQQAAAIRGSESWLDIISRWFDEIVDLLSTDPILWALLAVLAVILFIILKVIIFPSSRQSMVHDLDDSTEFQQATHAPPPTPSKLELAAAFIDMGNIRQAKIILREILTNGLPEEQQQARSLLAQL